MIKINSNRKVHFDRQKEDSHTLSRPRFISLQNSLPEKEAPQLPKWIDYIQGRTSKTDKTVHTVNIGYLENTFDTMMGNHTVKSKKNRKSSISSKDHHGGRVMSPSYL